MGNCSYFTPVSGVYDRSFKWFLRVPILYNKIDYINLSAIQLGWGKYYPFLKRKHRDRVARFLKIIPEMNSDWFLEEKKKPFLFGIVRHLFTGYKTRYRFVSGKAQETRLQQREPGPGVFKHFGTATKFEILGLLTGTFFSHPLKKTGHLIRLILSVHHQTAVIGLCQVPL